MSVEISNCEFSRLCIILQSEEKKRRIQGLKEIFKFLELQQSEDEVFKLWDVINKVLLRILNDSAEVCRDKALDIIRLFIINLTPNDKYIMYLLPILSRRLGSSELIETSEEVRLKCVILLKSIILKYKTLLALYIDDLVKILVRTVVDNYPLVKRESCNCISEFAKNLSRYFYTQSEILVKPILSNFTHQHYKVRIASIITIGDLIQYGNSKSLEEVATPLAERLFDQNGLVRTAVIEIAGNWLLKLRDRYSWWYKILPLLLTGLHDELETIREKAANFWDAVGQSYIEENQNNEKFKDKLDFLTEERHHYPNVTRPNLGCRTIAQQTFSKLLNGISLELGDWLADIRVRTAQLLCVFILNIEEEVIQHIGKLLPPMYRACNDEDYRVVETVERAAEYIGYFVHPKSYCHLIISFLDETLSVGHLKVFAAILREDCVFPGLIWSAGRAAEAIRTAALSCLCTILDKYEKDLIMDKIKHMKEQNISLTLDKIIPALISLADDNSKKSRLYSLQTMYFIMCIRKRFDHLTEEYIHKIYPVLLKRLDDGSDDIRIASLEALTKLWSTIPEDYDLNFNKGHIDTLYTTVIIYLDDPEKEFQNLTLGSLKELAKVHPELLYHKLQKCKMNFRNQQDIEILLEYCQDILSNT
nr:PREDICTED: dynein assembly factor 5, axonemal isoform X2 [Megachile rotundata]